MPGRHHAHRRETPGGSPPACLRASAGSSRARRIARGRRSARRSRRSGGREARIPRLPKSTASATRAGDDEPFTESPRLETSFRWGSYRPWDHLIGEPALGFPAFHVIGRGLCTTRSSAGWPVSPGHEAGKARLVGPLPFGSALRGVLALIPTGAWPGSESRTPAQGAGRRTNSHLVSRMNQRCTDRLRRAVRVFHSAASGSRPGRAGKPLPRPGAGVRCLHPPTPGPSPRASFWRDTRAPSGNVVHSGWRMSWAHALRGVRASRGETKLCCRIVRQCLILPWLVVGCDLLHSIVAGRVFATRRVPLSVEGTATPRRPLRRGRRA